jgi:CxxC motif-containing protein
MIRDLVCIMCPKGCRLKVEEQDGKYEVTGNLCRRGAEYGVKEVTNPTRVLTTTVKVKGSVVRRLPVVTKGEIPKDRLFEALEIINKVTVTPPIQVGDIVIADILRLGVSVTASRTVE